MSDDLANALGWVANYSSFYSVLTVLICFILMVVFILRLNGDLLLSSTATHHRVVEEQQMLPLTNPFSVHLQKEKKSSLKDGVYIDVSVLDTTLLTAIWGVNIQAFQQELNLSSGEIWERYQEKKLFGSKFMDYQDLGLVDVDDGNTPLNIQCPASVTEATLGEPPRLVYPIVIITARKNPDISLAYTAIVLQFTVLHLKDSVCSLDSHIVYQFLKTNHNQLLSLQPIFMSTTDSETSTVSPDETHQTSYTKSTSDQRNVTSSHCDKHFSDNDGKTHRKPDDFTERRSNFHTTEDVAACQHIHDNISQQNVHVNASCENCSCAKPTDQKSSSEDDILTEVVNTTILNQESNLCVVCQNAPVFYTLLSCRHACVCYSCIRLLDRCPMCRGFIDSYFRLDNAPDPEIPEKSEEDVARQRIPWWEALNNRLNHMLGFD